MVTVDFNIVIYVLQVRERLMAIWTAKVAVSEKIKGEQGLPRIIRLARKLKLSEKETLVLIYAFIVMVARSRGSGQPGR